MSAIGAETGELQYNHRWRVWLIVLLLALLWHIAFMLFHFNWGGITAPPRVEVTPVDAKKLEAIRKKWREQDKALLLDKNKSQPSAKEAPPNARYMSDKNIRVEKEQRAKQTAILPKPSTQKQATKPKVETKHRTLPKLGSLGLPLKLTPSPPPAPENPGPEGQSKETSPGGDQYVDDRNLPEGSENLLNAQESVFYSFFARLYEAIGPIWQSEASAVVYQRRIMPGEYTTVVDVELDPQGNLVKVNRLKSCGVDDLDQAVDRAWHKIERFPNPPKGLIKEDGKVHTGWSFTFRLQEGALQLMPPERNY